ncbi:MAG: SOS response-associated peptidase [Pseudomonadota bacterium]
MCGRFSLEAQWENLLKVMGIAQTSRLEPEMLPRYNIAPTQPIFVVRNGHDDAREGVLVRWGFVPAWVKNPKDFTLLINARSETAAEKPSFRNAIRHRRVLIPANGFYEWRRFGKGQKSQAYWVRPRDGGIMAFGGLMETWADHDGNGNEIDTACIVTTAANETFAPIHHRLPLIVHPKDSDRWLDCKSTTVDEVKDIMVPAPDDFFEAVPVGDAVNKVANATKDIQAPVDLPRQGEADEPKDDGQLSMF